MKYVPTLLFAVCGVFSGCAYSVDQLVKNDTLRENVIKQCLKMGVSAKDDKNCRTAAKAQVKVTGNKIKGLLD